MWPEYGDKKRPLAGSLSSWNNIEKWEFLGTEGSDYPE